MFAAYDQLAAWFGVRPKIMIYFYPAEAEFLENGGLKGMYGVAYSHDRLVLNWDGRILGVNRRFAMVHEMVHGFQNGLTGGYCTPNWVTEGLANYLADKIIWTKQPDALNIFDIANRTFQLGATQTANLYMDFKGGKDLNQWEVTNEMYDRANAEVGEQVKKAGGIEAYIKTTLTKCE